MNVHRCIVPALVLAGLLVAAPDAPARVVRLAEMNTAQIRALDRAHTAVILPGGIVEEHGPYLPAFSDGYYNEYLAGELARAIGARPGWTAVVFPTIPLGSGGANEIGGRFAFPGTYAVRPATLRAVFMDLADGFGEQGFRWLFVVHAHGSPDHNRALDQAGDYFHERYGGGMVNLWGLMVDEGRERLLESALGAEGMAENGFTVHGGAAEHSMILSLRPDVVSDAIHSAGPVSAAKPADLAEIAARDDWPGYFGSPRLASRELGRKLLEASVNARVKAALEILDGRDPAGFRRYADVMAGVPAIEDVMRRSRRHGAAREKAQSGWLSRPPAAARK